MVLAGGIADVSVETARTLYGGGASGARRRRDIGSDGRSVSQVDTVPAVAELVDRVDAEYRSAHDIVL